MQQLRLFGAELVSIKTINYENIKASIRNMGEFNFEIVLEINSNKFLIHFQTALDVIESMEIIAVKGFVELSLKVLKTIKKIVAQLYFDL